MTAKQSTRDRATVAAMESTQIDAAIQTMRQGQEAADKAWKVGDDDIGYLIVKAPTRGKARVKGGRDIGALDWAELTYVRVLREPKYDHLPERDAQRQWETDMKAEFGPGWGE